MKLSQTSVKDLENESTCPVRWKAQWIEGKITSPSTDAMTKGKYFEQLVLGSGAIDGEIVEDLPRLKNGDKSVDQIRIEEQAELCKEMLFNKESEHYLGFKVKDVQVRFDSGDRPIVLDILAEDETGMDVDLDLKLTKDVTQTYGKFGWGNIEHLDYLQQVHYHNVFKEVTGKDIRSILLVFDYSPNKGVKLIELDVTDAALDEAQIRFEAVEEVVDHYNKHGWIHLPSLKECEGCPLKCDKRFGLKPSILKFKVTV